MDTRRQKKWLTAALVAATLSGCYIPGGGWTMRTGLDFRTCYKPAAFLEMVDTRWDEYNRVALMNNTPNYGPTIGTPVMLSPSASEEAQQRNMQYVPQNPTPAQPTTPVPPQPGDTGARFNLIPRSTTQSEPQQVPPVSDESSLPPAIGQQAKASSRQGATGIVPTRGVLPQGKKANSATKIPTQMPKPASRKSSDDLINSEPVQRANKEVSLRDVESTASQDDGNPETTPPVTLRKTSKKKPKATGGWMFNSGR